MPIQKLGSLLKTDENGFLIREAHPSKIPPHWRPAVDRAIEAYREQYGEKLTGVYVRGTAARGTAIDHVSDLDLFAVADIEKDEMQPAWSKTLRIEIARRYPFIAGVEIIGVASRSLHKAKPPKTLNPWLRLIKTQSACVYGEDLAPRVPPVKPGIEMVSHALHLSEDLKNTPKYHAEDANPDERRKLCTWIMKRVIRTGFELVMERERAFTRDLYPCYEGFSRHYPAHEPLMLRALELCIHPTPSLEELSEALGPLGSFLCEEANRYWADKSTTK